jgi:hypothetical protein
MAIVYPLSAPSNTSDLKLMPNNIVGESVSPFTGSQQIFENPGEWWEAEFAVPPLYTRANAVPWLALLGALRGKSGSFYLGDPAAPAPLGASSTAINLLRQSEAIDQAVWVKSQCTVTGTNTVLDPNSSLTAEAVTANGGATDAAVLQQVYCVPGKTYAVSIWLKVPSGTKTINLYAIAKDRSGTLTAAIAQSCALTTAWQRFNAVVAAAMTDFQVAIQIGGGGSWTSGEIDMWGGQLERSSSMGAYDSLMRSSGPVVSGAGQTGKSLLTQWPGVNGPVTNLYLAGDYIEIQTTTASANTRRLHEVLTNSNADASGFSTLDLFPRLHESPANGDSIQIRDCRGTFRLKDNLRSWQLDNALLYQGIRLQCKEAF